MQATNVENQVFYLISNEGRLASVQVIYNNVAYVDDSLSLFLFPLPSSLFSLPRVYPT